jgi:hypothetical protein
MQKLIYTALFIMGVFLVAATPASATVLGEQSQEQKAEQEIKWKCNPGERTIITDSYGKVTEQWKNGDCEGSANQTVEQKQQQKILGDQVVYKDQRIHYPAGTALDGSTMAAVIGLATIGGLSYAAKRKLA